MSEKHYFQVSKVNKEECFICGLPENAAIHHHANPTVPTEVDKLAEDICDLMITSEIPFASPELQVDHSTQFHFKKAISAMIEEFETKVFQQTCNNIQLDNHNFISDEFHNCMERYKKVVAKCDKLESRLSETKKRLKEALCQWITDLTEVSQRLNNPDMGGMNHDTAKRIVKSLQKSMVALQTLIESEN